jgi:lipid-A-disaccharide synthase
MEAAGVTLVRGIEQLSVIGFAEVVGRLPAIVRLYREIRDRLRAQPPDAIVLIDYPGFNLRLARAASALGIPVIYYVSPQIWAWGERRLETIKAHVDTMIVILPFERDYYAARGVDARFVGHPLLSVAKASCAPGEFRARLGIAEGVPLVGLLPGSRVQEVRAHVSLLCDALAMVRAQRGPVAAVIGRAPTVSETLLREALRGGDVRTTTDTYDLMASADCLVVASGTATLEAALFATPMIVIYRTSPLSYAIGKRVVRVPHIALVNLVAGERIVPELVQADARPHAIAGEIVSLLSDAGRRERMRAALRQVRGRLGEPGAAGRAAQIVLDRIDGRDAA